MAKKILIVAASILILVAGGMWVYALLNPSTGNEGFFANFGIGNDAANLTVENVGVQDFEDGTEETAEVRLRQITTNPVAGAAFTKSGIIYVEQGTGHIRYINLTTGEETLLSATTIPGAYEASFSKDGEVVAVTTTQDTSSKTIVASVPNASSTESLDGVALPLGASEVNVSEKSGTAYYLISTTNGSRGYAYSIAKKTSTELFSIPLRDIHVLWGEPLYVYTTPTHTQIGYVYRLAGNEMRYVSEGALGLMASRYGSDPIVTKKTTTTDGGDFWFSSIETAVRQVPLGGVMIPEKCIPTETDFWCAVPQNIDSQFPDSWYKGTVSLSDSLWRITASGESATVESDFFVESGRQIDVLEIGIDSFNTYLYLINKNDNTLWLYKL